MTHAPQTTAETRTRLAEKSPSFTIDSPRISSLVDPIERDPRRGFHSPGAFLAAVANAQMNNHRTPEYEKWCNVQAAAGVSSHDVGIVVPEAYSPIGLLKTTQERDILAGRVTRIDMKTRKVVIPRFDDSDHASITDGLRWYRRDEGSELPATHPKFGAVVLEAKKASVLSYVSEEAGADSLEAYAQILQLGAANGLASTLMRERVRGSGLDEYLGILNSPAKVVVAKESGQSAGTLLYTNLAKMAARCLRFDSDGVWLCTPSARTAIYEINRTAGVPLWTPPQTEGAPGLLFGRPAFFAEACSALGTEGDIICMVPAEYVEGVYAPLRQTESVHVRFVHDERCFRFSTLCAGQPWLSAAITPEIGSDTLSAYVVLAARG